LRKAARYSCIFGDLPTISPNRHELAGVEVSVKQVERAAEALGAEIAGRTGKQPDVPLTREAKVVAMWSVEHINQSAPVNVSHLPL
jgi:hypothetical protein